MVGGIHAYLKIFIHRAFVKNIQRMILKKVLFTSFGIFFCLLGVLGVFLPVLPGIYFILFGLGFLFRAFPSLFIFLKIFRLEDKIKKSLSMRTKMLIIAGVWSPFLITSLANYLIMKERMLNNPKYFLSFLVFVFPISLSIWILKVKNTAEILGYKVKSKGESIVNDTT